jgi:hypothetical protein
MGNYVNRECCGTSFMYEYGENGLKDRLGPLNFGK